MLIRQKNPVQPYEATGAVIDYHSDQKRERFCKCKKMGLRDEAAIIIQRRFRAFIERVRYLDKIAKIIKIQRWWRKWNIQQRLYDEEVVARVTTVQALVRGFLARRRLAKAKTAKEAEEKEHWRREEEEALETKRIKEDEEQKKQEEEEKSSKIKLEKSRAALDVNELARREAEEAKRAEAERKEERNSLLEGAPTGEEEEERKAAVDEEQKGCGCFTSWLVYIFIKIFD